MIIKRVLIDPEKHTTVLLKDIIGFVDVKEGDDYGLRLSALDQHIIFRAKKSIHRLVRSGGAPGEAVWSTPLVVATDSDSIAIPHMRVLTPPTTKLEKVFYDAAKVSEIFVVDDDGLRELITEFYQ